ncbi:uncharacterized protein METZ01_LOCUS297425, partial [marine metagenome]
SGSSDPTISTNPGTVGTKYKNTTDGEIFICTDATAGANVWKNVGAGTGDVEPVPPAWEAAGENYGYVQGSVPNSGAPGTRIEKFSFTSDGNSVDSGADTIDYYSPGGLKQCAVTSSPTKGYIMGGGLVSGSETDTIQRFTFGSSGTATDVANLTTARLKCTGVNNLTYGYCCGGAEEAGGYQNVPINVIDKMAFATEADSTGHGNLSTYAGGRGTDSGNASSTAGYTSGYYRSGGTPPLSRNIIDKFLFSSNTTSSDVGDLNPSTYFNVGTSSGTHGYVSGYAADGVMEKIQKYSFASESTITSPGNLSVDRGNGAGCSSTSYGYMAGGYQYPPFAPSKVIDKYSFTTDGNATGVGDLLIIGYQSRGLQH